jgi:pimeloyl-ACP methyl ester carboxylesterase
MGCRGRGFTHILAVFILAPIAAWAGEVTAGLTAINGTKLHYEMTGEGHPLVLIHGGVLDSTEWDEQFLPLAARYRVIRYDVRGFGQSETRKLPYSDVEDLYGLLAFLKVKKAFLLGGSSGGAIAIDFALEHPDMVDALVLVGTVVGGWQYSPAFMQRGSTILMAAVQEGAAKAADLPRRAISSVSGTRQEQRLASVDADRRPTG